MENKDLKFIDIHCHYDNLSLAEFAKGEISAVANNIDIESYRKLERIRRENIRGLYFAYGIYPDVVIKEGLKDCLNYLNIILEDTKKIVAIGEIGLDYKITKDPELRREQKIVFEKQLEIAKENKLPAIIHSRYATKAVLDILKSWGGFPIILHQFSGNEKEIEIALDRNYYLTIRFNKPNLPNIKEHLDHIFVETDYPVFFEEEPITISDIKKSYKLLANENNIDLEELKEKINSNFNKIFLKKE